MLIFIISSSLIFVVFYLNLHGRWLSGVTTPNILTLPQKEIYCMLANAISSASCVRFNSCHCLSCLLISIAI